MKIPFNNAWIQTPFAGVVHLLFDENDEEQVQEVRREVHPLDIIYSLSRISRFGGFAGCGVKMKDTTFFFSWENAFAVLFDDHHYSVAEHVIHASYLAPPGFEWEALMHDNSEAYFGDMTRPLKRECRDYRYHLGCFDRCIMTEVFGVPYPMSPEVKEVDNRLLWTEALDMFGEPNVNWYGGGDPPKAYKGVDFWYHGPEKAARAFIERYNELAIPRREAGLPAPELVV